MGPIGSAILTFIGYKQTPPSEAKFIIDIYLYMSMLAKARQTAGLIGGAIFLRNPCVPWWEHKLKKLDFFLTKFDFFSKFGFFSWATPSNSAINIYFVLYN